MKYWLDIGLRLVLIGLLLSGLLLRFYKLNWDDGHHLHPDERFLTMVVLDLDWPSSWREYIDARISPLNPRNQVYDFYVYGTLPLVLVRLFASAATMVDYDHLTQVGRHMSAIGDVLIGLGVMVGAWALVKIYGWSRRLILYSGFVYAWMTLPIQLAHFFTTDPYAVLFGFWSVVGSWWYRASNKLGWVLFSGVCFGLGMAAKVSVLYVLPVILGAIFMRGWVQHDQERISWKSSVLRMGLATGVFMLSSFVILRIADPALFANDSFFRVAINPDFLEDIAELQRFAHDDVWYPPAIQWIGTPAVWFALENMALHGVGLGIFIMIIGGIGVMLWYAAKFTEQRRIELLLLVGYVVGVFGYQSSQFVKALRYFYVLYPFLAILAGLFLMQLGELRVARLPTKLLRFGMVTLMVWGLLWPLSFISIYTKPHTRVAASIYMHEQLDPGSTIVFEHWDDPLPLRLPGYPPGFTGSPLPVFGEDTSEKWAEMNRLLSEADYYVLSSNRGWGSIGPRPDKYPLMSRFYKELLSGRMGYPLIYDGTSYPSLSYLGIPWSYRDDRADETFTVYDHPRVLIFDLKP